MYHVRFDPNHRCADLPEQFDGCRSNRWTIEAQILTGLRALATTIPDQTKTGAAA